MTLDDNNRASALFKRIDSSLEGLDKLEDLYQQQKAALTNELAASISQLGQLADTQALRAQIVRELYWKEKVPPEMIGAAFGLGKHSLIKIAGSITMNFPCRNDCEKPVKQTFKSRAGLQSYLREGRNTRGLYRDHYLCEDCRKREDAERKAKALQRRLELRLRDEQLQNMSWNEFVDSKEWKRYRNQYVHAVGYQCEICHTYEGVLHIHLDPAATQGHPKVSKNQFSCTVVCTNCKQERCYDLINPEKGEPLTRESRSHIMNWNQQHHSDSEDVFMDGL